MSTNGWPASMDMSPEERASHFKARCDAFMAQRSSFEGANGIYIEREGTLYVRITDVSSDGWGVSAAMTDLLVPGMRRLPRNPCKLGAAWELFSWNRCHWDFPNIPGCRWQLFFNDEIIGPCLELAATAHGNGSVVQWMQAKAVVTKFVRASWKTLAPRDPRC